MIHGYTVAPVSIAATQEEMQMPPTSAPAPTGTAADHTPLRIMAMRMRRSE
jgi:hypothetical protein